MGMGQTQTGEAWSIRYWRAQQGYARLRDRLAAAEALLREALEYTAIDAEPACCAGCAFLLRVRAQMAQREEDQ